MKLSATKIQTYEECPLKFKYIFVLQLMQKDSVALEVGTAYHKALEEYYKNGYEYAINNISTNVTKDLIIKMLDKYLQNPVNGDIINSEQFFSLEYDGVEFTGKIDREDTDKIVEYKSTSLDYKDEQCKGVQANMYSYAVFRLTGVKKDVVYSITNKKKLDSKKYKSQIITVKADELDYSKFEEKLKKIDTLIKNKDFKHNPGTHCYFCPFGRKSGTGNCVYSL